MNEINTNLLGDLIGGDSGPLELQYHILGYLGPKDLSVASIVKNSMKDGISEVWKKVVKELKYPVDKQQGHVRNYQNFIEDFLLVIDTGPESKVPENTLKIAKDALMTPPTVEQARELQEYAREVRARDTLTVWQKVAASARIVVDFSQALKTPETTIEKADHFAEWIRENKTGLNAIEYLDLSKKELDFIPSEIGMLTKLVSLNLYKNRLKAIPKELEHLKKLKVLVLAENQITNIPSEFGSLPKLTILKLSNNRLGSIPETLGNLKKLQTLCLENNSLKSIPKKLTNLKKLSSLDISGNQLIEIPNEIRAMPSLRELLTDGNPLKSAITRSGT